MHPNQVSTWKERAVEGMKEVFTKGRNAHEGTMRGRSGICTRRSGS